MKRVFLDTNVVIDFFQKREDFYYPAAVIIDLALKREIEIIVSAMTFVNAFYILRKYYDSADLYRSMKSIADVCSISAVTRDEICNALDEEWKDFEDCVQYKSSMTANADIIITRNIEDFNKSQLEVLSPIDFIKSFIP